jgi:hypothetical protein
VLCRENLLEQKHCADWAQPPNQAHFAITVLGKPSGCRAHGSEAAAVQHWCFTAAAAGSVTR